MKKLLKKMLPNCIINKVFQYLNRPIYNLFETNYTKTVLISYLVRPFRINNSNFNAHTNYLEALLIAETFKELGYNIDLVDFRDDCQLEYNRYQLIIGFGKSFNASFVGSNSIVRILYMTGTERSFQNKAELERIKNLYLRKGVWIQPKRIVNESWSDYAVISDAVISTGNDFTVSTFNNIHQSRIFKVSLPIYENNLYSILKRNFKESKYNFLWFGSSGLVHKGLDLCIEFFAKNPKYTLHICGPIEKDFFDLYQIELNAKNIIYHGRLNIESLEYYEIVNKCLFAVAPSCSEGGGAALLTVMRSGLIPIATIESSVDLQNHGYIIEEPSLHGIEQAIEKAFNDSENIHQSKSEESEFFVKTKFTKENFKNSLKIALTNTLKIKISN